MLKFNKTYKKGIGGSDKRDAKTDTIGANHEKIRLVVYLVLI
ncbi:hypothetical protein AGMMS49936_11260 [Endomicrobiia bacterium]|nr:hypothetical protein AGMMS49936_11260 [Endomicrobiia bacterium]